VHQTKCPLVPDDAEETVMDIATAVDEFGDADTVKVVAGS
jgi:hypothetical protein